MGIVRIGNIASGLIAAIGLAIGSADAANAGPPLILQQTNPTPSMSLVASITWPSMLLGNACSSPSWATAASMFVDLQAGKAVKRINGLKEPQGVAYVPDQDLIFVAGAGDGSVRFFRAADLFAWVGNHRPWRGCGQSPDRPRHRTRSRRITAMAGWRSIDPSTRSKLEDIKLPGHPESFQLDPVTDRVYVNVPDAHQVVCR